MAPYCAARDEQIPICCRGWRIQIPHQYIIVEIIVMYHVPKADTYSPKYGGCQDHAPIGRCALKVSPVAGLTGFPLVSRRQHKQKRLRKFLE